MSDVNVVTPGARVTKRKVMVDDGAQTQGRSLRCPATPFWCTPPSMPPTAAASPSSTGSSSVCTIATAMKSPADGGEDPGWLVLLDAAGRRVFAFQQVPGPRSADLARP